MEVVSSAVFPQKLNFTHSSECEQTAELPGEKERDHSLICFTLWVVKTLEARDTRGVYSSSSDLGPFLEQNLASFHRGISFQQKNSGCQDTLNHDIAMR